MALMSVGLERIFIRIPTVMSAISLDFDSMFS